MLLVSLLPQSILAALALVYDDGLRFFIFVLTAVVHFFNVLSLSLLFLLWLLSGVASFLRLQFGHCYKRLHVMTAVLLLTVLVTVNALLL